VQVAVRGRGLGGTGAVAKIPGIGFRIQGVVAERDGRRRHEFFRRSGKARYRLYGASAEEKRKESEKEEGMFHAVQSNFAAKEINFRRIPVLRNCFKTQKQPIFTTNLYL
jgi:hypothetical protein